MAYSYFLPKQVYPPQITVTPPVSDERLEVVAHLKRPVEPIRHEDFTYEGKPIERAKSTFRFFDSNRSRAVLSIIGWGPKRAGGRRKAILEASVASQPRGKRPPVVPKTVISQPGSYAYGDLAVF